MKHTSKITNWEIVKHPYYNDYVLKGKISEHENQDQFKSEVQLTSPIVKIDLVENIAETRNTIYILVSNET